MSDSYIIEVSSQPAGIVVRNPKGFRFFAASRRFHSMEGQLFRNAREAERAAVQLEKRQIMPIVAAPMRNDRG
jgi:hypothetical protein